MRFTGSRFKEEVGIYFVGLGRIVILGNGTTFSITNHRYKLKVIACSVPVSLRPILGATVYLYTSRFSKTSSRVIVNAPNFWLNAECFLTMAPVLSGYPKEALKV